MRDRISLARRAPASRSTLAVQRRDRPWADAYVAALCGPFAMPSVEDLRAAVASLTDRYPHSRLNWRLEPGGRRWALANDTDSVVVEGNWDSGRSMGATLDAIASDGSLPAPLALIRYPNHLGLRMSHSIGDGRIFNTIFSAVLRTALTGEPYPWAGQPAPPFPLARAIYHTFNAGPCRIRAAIADRPAKTGAAFAQGRMRAWKPARRTLFASMAVPDTDDIAARAKQFAPGSTRAALQMCLLLRSLRGCGLRVAPEVNLVVDLRRYLDSLLIDGNFVAGVPVRIDSAIAPDATSAAIKATMSSGRPLATQALSSLRGGGTAKLPAAIDATALPRVTFSGMGRPPEIGSLPFLAGSPAIYAGGVEPDGPLGLTFLLVETSTTVAITASFHDTAIDAAVVNDALRLATSDPLGVLTEATVRP